MGKTPKDFIFGSEPLLKNLATEIVRICVKNNVTIRPEVVSLTVGLLSLDPKNGFILESHANRRHVESFVSKCVEIFLENDSSFVKTLELQVLFMEKSLDLDKIEEIYEERMKAKTDLLVQDIMEFEINEVVDQEKLLYKITVDVIVSNKFGRPNNAQVYSETSHALKSVFSRADLLEFAKLTKRKRLEILNHLRQLVCGIRIFNKDAGHCDEGVRDIISDVSLGLKNTKSAFTDVLLKVNKEICSMVKVFKDVFAHEEDLLPLIEEDDFNNLRDYLILNTQYQQFINNLLETLNRIKKDVDKLFEEFKKTLVNLHDALKFRIAVATEKVFPYFVHLSKIWKALMTYLYVLVELNTLNDEMRDIVGSSIYFEEMLHPIAKVTKDIPRKIVYPETVQVTHPECEVITATENLSYKPFYKFCAYYFIHGNGILMPAKEQLGLLHYKDYYFAFSEVGHMNKFSKNIEKNISTFLDTVRRNPQIIVFFDLFDEIVNLPAEQEEIRVATEMKMISIETQTELHPIPFRKEKDYTWNIWDLRRKAIQLANIKKCKTHSVQTEISYFRLCSQLQTVEPIQKSNQTMKTTSTNPTKEKNCCIGKVMKPLSCEIPIRKVSTISTATDNQYSECDDLHYTGK